jgi:hypothetical protein
MLRGMMPTLEAARAVLLRSRETKRGVKACIFFLSLWLERVFVFLLAAKVGVENE